MSNFQLSAILRGHEQDVRVVSGLPGSAIGSGSRDRTVRLWPRQRSEFASAPLSNSSIRYSGHDAFVNCMAYLPGRLVPESSDGIDGFIITGSADKMIHAFPVPKDASTVDPSDPPIEPMYILIGHEQHVCSLDVSESNGAIISGSWDHTAKIWYKWDQVATLYGHEMAVWSVLFLTGSDADPWTKMRPSNVQINAGVFNFAHEYLATASADKTIRLWRGGKCERILTGHTDVVRSLTRVPGVGFASCSNDCTVRLWGAMGQCLRELHGHNNYVYSLSMLPGGGGELVSSGEDRTVRVWDTRRTGGKSPIQTINLPARSIWSVAGLENGDIAAGTDNGAIYVFSRNADLRADDDALKSYNEAVANFAVSTQEIGGINKNQLPGIEALHQQGKKDDQTIMIYNKENDTIEAYQWSASELQWNKVGEVVDSAGSGRKQIYEGREYDYVFDIALEDGAPDYKLPYNMNMNPYEAAQNFIHNNNLSQSFLDQIANFIMRNTQGHTIGGSPAAIAPQSPPQTYTSPSQGPQSKPAARAGSNVKPRLVISLPPDYVFVRQAKVSGIVGKIREFSSALPDGVGYSAKELAQLDALTPKLTQVAASQSTSVAITADEYAVLLKVIEGWPSGKRFPVIDLLRLCVLATPLTVTGRDEEQIVVDLLTATIPHEDEEMAGIVLSVKERYTLETMQLRALSNVFGTAAGASMAWTQRETIVPTIIDAQITRAGEMADSANAAAANVATATSNAFASILLNYAVFVSKNSGAHNAAGVKLVDVNSLIEQFSSAVEATIATGKDGEAIYRLMVAIGTLTTLYPDSVSALLKHFPRAALDTLDTSKHQLLKELCSAFKATFAQAQ
ncbi:PFU-domain-containing protein [Ramicandelaber brevisporus]|nr:PFU-domain-containing protein [Ramicandelaber brevisporus]